jgi:uncharacterized protein YdeI (YjbR/CyaY-like superfamily)
MPSRSGTSPRFFASATQFRLWLQQNAATASELWVGYWKIAAGRPTLTWSESVDQALCFGWIDGIRKRVDEDRYTIRFTPRKPGSVWSAVNVAKVEALQRAKLMQPGGLAAFKSKRDHRSGIYSYEQRSVQLPEPYLGALKEARRAHRFFEAQTASYRKAAVWWVLSARQESTRLRRLEQLVRDSGEGRQIKQFARPARKSDA